MDVTATEHIKSRFQIGEDTPRPYKLLGANRETLHRLFAELGYTIGCEVGLEKGRHARDMFEHIPGLRLYCVDPYRQHPQCSYEATAYLRHWDERYLRHVRHQAQKRLHGLSYTLIQKFSEDAARDITDNSLDFVYIDGDHSYDFVMLDLILWGRKVRKGGIVSGHDYYYDNNKPGRRAKVTQAVNDYARVHGIELFITDEKHYEKRGDHYPSWLWVKEQDNWPNVVGA